MKDSYSSESVPQARLAFVFQNDRWEVVDESGELADPPVLKPGETILFEARESQVALQFPQADLFREFKEFTATVARGESLALTLRSGAVTKQTVIVYAAYCVAEKHPMDYAVGGSPPIIVMKPD